MAEWLIALVLKTSAPNRCRGFESLCVRLESRPRMRSPFHMDGVGSGYFFMLSNLSTGSRIILPCGLIGV